MRRTAGGGSFSRLDEMNYVVARWRMDYNPCRPESRLRVMACKIVAPSDNRWTNKRGPATGASLDAEISRWADRKVML